MTQDAFSLAANGAADKPQDGIKYGLIMDETTQVSGRTLYRIRALRNLEFRKNKKIVMRVNAFDKGGFVESTANLSQEGLCWIFDDACALGNARVTEDARLHQNALAYEFSKIHGRAEMWDRSRAYGQAEVFGKAVLSGRAEAAGKARIYGDFSARYEVYTNGNHYLKRLTR